MGVTQTGSQDGLRTRRDGAATTSRLGAFRFRSPTIAKPATRIGKQDGLRTRKGGAAPTKKWAALLQSHSDWAPSQFVCRLALATSPIQFSIFILASRPAP